MKMNAPAQSMVFPLVGTICATAALYYFFPTAQQSGDSLGHALAARSGGAMFHPHHLVFAPAVRSVWILLRGMGFEIDVIRAAQIHNLLFALVAVAAVVLTLRSLTGSTGLATGAGLIFAVSRGVWLFTSQAEVYVPAAGCLSAFVGLMVTQEEPLLWSGRRRFAASAFLVLAVLYHQSSVLIVLPFLASAVVRRGRARSIACAVVITAGLATIAAYAAAFFLAGPSPSVSALMSTGAEPSRFTAFLRFCVAYVYHPSPDWGRLNNVSLHGLVNLAESQLSTLADVPASLKFPSVAALSMVLCGVFAWHLRNVFVKSSLRHLRVLLLGWLAVHNLFFLWWLPGEPEFFIVSLLPWVLAIALLAAEIGYRVPRHVALAFASIAVGGLAVSTLTQTILPRHEPGPAYRKALAIAEQAPEGCRIGASYEVLQNLCYYFNRTDAFEISTVLLDAYRTQRLPKPRHHCLLVPWEVVLPNRSTDGFSGVTHPQGWAAFVSWLLQVNSDAFGVRSRPFQLVTDSLGNRWLQVGTEAASLSSLGAIFSALDQLAKSRAEKSEAPFSTWYAKNGSTVDMSVAGRRAP